MATAGQLRQEFQQYLDQKGCRYTVVDESDNIVRIGFAASSHMEDGGHRTRIYVDFDEEPDVDGIPCVHFVAQDFASCTAENVPAVLVKLNELNKRFRWAKFWLDQSDNTISCDGDAMIFEGSVGSECWRFVIHVSNIVEKGFIELGSLVKDNHADDGGNGGPSQSELLAMLEALRGMLGQQ